MNTFNREKTLERLTQIEELAKAIIHTPGVKLEYPQATEQVHQIINSVSLAYIKFNEGDSKQ